MMRRLPLTVLLALTAGCMPATDAGSTAPGPAEAARHRAALASIYVDNRTGTTLAIDYRHAVPPVTFVRIGVVAPGQRVLLAPVPAGEPIVLTASTDAVTIELPPRTFEVGETWVWKVQP